MAIGSRLAAIGVATLGRPYRASATDAEVARVSDSVAKQVRDLESMNERLRRVSSAAAVLLEWKVESKGSAFSVPR